MGVRRLQTFLEGNCPLACYRVKIASLANEYRDLYGEDPVIVMDGSSCSRVLYGKLDWICGGQMKEYADFLQSFFQKFKDLGIKIAVFFEGSTHDKRRDVWNDRRYQDMKKAHSIIDKLEGGCDVRSISHGDFITPSGITSVMESVSKANAEVFRCTKNDHVYKIASYAEKNKCLAILGQNSDFVIFNLTVSKYLSIEHLDLPTMSSIVYDREELASYLKLHLNELPVLATLMGTDTFVYHELKKFHRQILGKYQQNNVAPLLVKKLAEYVINLPKGEDLMLYLEQLSKIMFGNPRRAGDLKKSIESYDLSIPKEDSYEFSGTDIWSNILERAHKDCVTLISPPPLFLLMQYRKYELPTALEDYRSETPVSAKVLSPLRQRLYGVVLREYPAVEGEKVTVEEYCMTGPKSLDAPVKVEPVTPPDIFPELLELWESDSETLTSRFNVLAWICSKPLFDACLEEDTAAPPEILAPLCLLSFLYKDASVLTDLDVKVFAAVAMDVQSMDSEELSQISISTVDVRGVQLASLYTRAINVLMNANALTGFPIPPKWVTHESIFDGKLFQSKYLSCNTGGEQLLQKGSESNYELLCKLVLE